MGRGSLLGRWTVYVLAVALIAACSSADQRDEANRAGSTTVEPAEAAKGPDSGGGAEPALAETDAGGPAPLPFSPDSPIRVDQFGYRPVDPKWAVLVDPEQGFNQDIDYRPGSTIEVRRVDDGSVVFAGEATPWDGGRVHRQSGDRGWWFDFSAVQSPGSYYVFDPEAAVAGPEFVIADDVYDQVFNAAFRMFWFNRANTAHHENLAGPWNDAAAFVGPGQDLEARSIDDPDNPATARDLSGGWFDAGDTNKYVTFAGEPVHVLLTAYQRAPAVFDDQQQIPESGNGVPDLIDEILWELDWLERMQLDDGSVLTKVGVTELEGPTTPSESVLPRFYEEACSSSTIVAAGVFAHAALVLKSIDTVADSADRFEERAVKAWRWYSTNPRRDDCDPQIIWAGDADLSLEEQDREEVVAAVYLYALTGADEYHDVVRRGYDRTTPFSGEGFGHYGLDQADALVAYGGLDNADPTLVAAIADRIEDVSSWSPLFGPPADELYRSHLPDTAYHWGSNMVMANAGTANLLIDDQAAGLDRALAHLHYFHGVNPLGVTYLSNTSAAGADNPVRQLFHFWFGDESPYDVSIGSDIGTAPGYLVGGPNQFYSGSDSPPAGQPPQKSYRDWAAYGTQPTWETTEPAIYYQAAYLRLLAEVLGAQRP